MGRMGFKTQREVVGKGRTLFRYGGLGCVCVGRSAPGNRNSAHFSGDEDEVVLPWCTSSQRRGFEEWVNYIYSQTPPNTHIMRVSFHSKWQDAFEKQLVILALVAIVGLFVARDVISQEQLREWLQSNITRLL